MDKSQKKANFKRISKKRISNLKNSFRLVAALSNKSYYEYSQRDIQKIFDEIDKEVADLKSSFSEGSSHKSFKLTE